MTLVLALVDAAGNIYAGADSAISGQGEIYEFSEPKVFLKGSYLIGYCQSARLGQVLQYHFDPPEPSANDEDLHEFLVTTFVPAMCRVLETHGPMAPGSVNLPPDSVVLVGYRGRLWCIATNLMVGEMTPCAAIGSGRHHAYGALRVLIASGAEPPRRIVELTLEAAAEHAPGVRPPFRFVELPMAGPEPQVGLVPSASSGAAKTEMVLTGE